MTTREMLQPFADKLATRLTGRDAGGNRVRYDDKMLPVVVSTAMPPPVAEHHALTHASVANELLDLADACCKAILDEVNAGTGSPVDTNPDV